MGESFCLIINTVYLSIYTFSGTWVVVEPDQTSESKDSKQRESSSTAASTAKPGTSSENVSASAKSTPKQGGKSDDSSGVSRPPPHLLNYYLQVSKVIIGGSTSLLEVNLQLSFCSNIVGL